MMFDILIKDGLIIDGTTNPGFRADIGLRDGKINRIRNLAKAEASQTINAQDHVVSPGFIDTHSHSDLMLLVEPEAKQKIMQGITTEILGQDGISIAPHPITISESWRKHLSGLLGDPPVEWDWETVADYFQRVETQGTATNVAYLVPHGTVRACVMEMEDRDATPEELAQMEAVIDHAMQDGAVGMSTGMIYTPCVYAKGTKELIALCKRVAAHGGVFVIHMRNESDQIIDAFQETVEIGKAADVAIHISHIKVAGRRNWDKIDLLLQSIDDARAQGNDVTVDQYPYIAGSTMLAAILPPWVHEGGTSEVLRRLTDPETREKIIQDINQMRPGWENIVGRGGWNDIMITHLPSKKNHQFIGKRVSEIAQLVGKPPADTAFDLLIEEDLTVSMVTFWGNEETVTTAMRHPVQMVGTDGLLGGKPHPRVYGTCPRILGKYTREEQVLTLEDAIRKMTSLPAQRFGFQDRGLIREGLAGDLVIFDPKQIIDKATFEDPHQYSEGIEYVLVNGTVVKKGDTHTGNLPGKILRHKSVT